MHERISRQAAIVAIPTEQCTNIILTQQGAVTAMQAVAVEANTSLAIRLLHAKPAHRGIDEGHQRQHVAGLVMIGGAFDQYWMQAVRAQELGQCHARDPRADHQHAQAVVAHAPQLRLDRLRDEHINRAQYTLLGPC